MPPACLPDPVRFPVRHDPRLMCGLDRIEVIDHVARVDIPRLHATDMTGCIAVVRELDPLVERIDVYAGSEPDICYQRTGQRWAAFNLTRRKPHVASA